MAEDGFIQRAKIIVIFPNIGLAQFLNKQDEILPDTTINVFAIGKYHNDPPSWDGVEDRDTIIGNAPKRIGLDELMQVRGRLLDDMEGPISRPGLIIIDDNYDPDIGIVDLMEEGDLDFKMVSPARTDINLAYMPKHLDAPMRPEWLERLQRLKDVWDSDPLPDRKKLELPEGQYLSDVIKQIMAEPIPERRPAIDPFIGLESDVDVDVDADVDAGTDTGQPLRHGHHTDNRIGSNTSIRPWPLAFSNVIVNSPYSQNKSCGRTKTFFRWFFFLANVLLVVSLAYVLYNVALDYEEFILSDSAQKRAILEDPADWVEESPFYIWTAWPQKLRKMALPYAKRRQVSEELLDTVAKWVHTERFLRASDPGWQFSDLLQRLRNLGWITSATHT